MSAPEHTLRAELEEFEPRILYAADLAAAIGSLPLGTGVQHHLLTGAAEARQPAGVELVVVDLALPDSASLLAGLQAQRDAGRRLDIVTIGAGTDGVDAVTQALGAHDAVAAVHLLSHGQAGSLQLGSVTLDARTLLQRAAEIARWGQALGAEADLLLYGCDVAANPEGDALLQGLAALTGADVAASTDPTGHALLGGDWQLEAATGTIDAAPLADASLQKTWQQLMLTPLTPWRVNDDTGGNQSTDTVSRGSTQSVAYASTGRFVVVWTSDTQDGDRRGVYFRLYEADGTAIGATETLVNSETDKDQRHASVAMADDGSFVVTWASDGQDSEGWGVYAQRFNANGVRLGGEFRVNTHQSGDQTNPVIGMNRATGDFVIAWAGEGATQSAAIYAQRYNAAGVVQGSNVLVSTTNRGTEANPTVAMDRQGRFVVAWDVGGGVYLQRYAANGTSAGSEIHVNSTNSGQHAAVAMDAQGNFSVAYRQTNGSKGIVLRGYMADGSDRYQTVRVSVADGNSASLALDATGRAVVTWDGAGSSGTDVLMRRLDASGLSVVTNGADASGVVQVNTGTVPADMASGTQANASVALLDLEHFVVVWSGKVDPDRDGVAARRYALPPTSPQLTSYAGASAVDRSVAENTRSAAMVTATDPNQPLQALQYRVVLDNPAFPDGALFELVDSVDPATGLNRAELRFVTAPNFEQPLDANEDNVYWVRVEVSDGTSAPPVTQDFAVTVTDQADHATALDGGFSVPVSTTGSLSVRGLMSSPVSSDMLLLDMTLPEGQYGADPAILLFRPGNDADPLGYQSPATAGTTVFDYRVDDGQSDLRHYWRLDESATGAAVDAVGGHAPGYGPLDSTPVQGHWGYAVDMVATGDEVRIPDVDYGSGFTLGLWFQLTNFTDGYQTLLSHGQPGQANSLTIQVAGNLVPTADLGQLIIEIRDGDDASVGRITTTIWPLVGDGQWHHVMLTVQPGAGATAYLDDMATAFGQTPAGGGLVNPAGDLVLGRTTTGTLEYNGMLDTFALWGHALSAAERAEAHDPAVSGGTLTIDVVSSSPTPTPVGSDDRYVLREDDAIVAGEFATTAWLAPGWMSRQRIDLSNTSGAAIVDTPVLVTLTPGTVDYLRMNASGTDLRFFDSTGTPLAYQIETWDRGGTTTVWVRMPSIATGSSEIWMYYENADAPAAQDATAVWGAGAAAVLHMGGSLVDATVNGVNPVSSTDVTVQAVGRLGGASDFNGSTSDINLGSPAAIDNLFGSGGGAGGTVSAWIFARGPGEGGYGRIADKSDDTNATVGWVFHVMPTGQLFFESVGSFAISVPVSWTTPADKVVAFGQWQHVAVSFDSTSPNTAPTFYINGIAVVGVHDSGYVLTSRSDDNTDLHIGNHTSASTSTFDGSIDELRLYTTARSTASILSEFAAGAPGLVTLNPSIQRARVSVDDTAANPVTVELLSGPAHAASFQLHADGSFDYQPVANFSGIDSFSYRPIDGALTGQAVTVTLDLSSRPDAPVIDSHGGAASVVLPHNENAVPVASFSATDADEAADQLSWSLLQPADDARSTDAARFSFDAATRTLRFVTAPDYEAPADSDGTNTYDVVVRVTDSTGRTDDQWVSVHVTNLVEASVAVRDAATTEPNQSVTVTVMDNDLLDAQASSALLDVSHGSFGRARIVGNSLQYVPDAERFGVDTLRYRLVDSNENLQRYWRLDGSATDVVGTAGSSLAGGVATVAGVWGDALAFDGDDDVAVLGDVSYAGAFSLGFWFRMDGVANSGTPTLYTHGSWGQAQSLSVYFEPDPTSGDPAVLRTALRDADDTGDSSALDIAVSDGLGNSLTDNAWHYYTLVVGPGGAVVYVDGVARANSTNGGGAFDPTGLAMLGRATEDPSARPLSSRPLTGAIDSLALYSQALDATGVQRAMTGGSSTADVEVTVAVDKPPVIVSDGGGATAALTVSETQTRVTQVVADDPYNASPDLHYAIVGGMHAANFIIDEATGVLSFRVAPDTEGSWGVGGWMMPLDGPGRSHVYEVQVEARDAAAPGGQTDVQALTVTVTDVDDNPLSIVFDSDDLVSGPVTANDRVGEDAPTGSRVGVTAHALDIDRAAVVTYSLLNDAGGLVQIDANTGVVTTAGSLRALGGSTLNFTVQARSGSQTQQADFVVQVLDTVDDEPVSAPRDIDPSTNTVAEGAAAGTAVGIVLQADDPDPADAPVTYALVDNPGNRYRLEAVNGGGAVRLVTNALFDLDVANAETTHTVAVAAYSGRGGAAGAVSWFTIEVTRVDEHPLGPLTDTDTAANRITENQDALAPVTGLSIQALDPDLPSVVSYSLLDNAQGRFVIDAASGLVSAARPLDFETDGGKHLVTVQARSGDSVVEQRFEIEVVDSNDIGLVQLVDDDARPDTVDERSPIGSPVGLLLRAVDGDVSGAGTVSYALLDDAGGRFTIDSGGTVRLAGVLAESALGEYRIVAQASSPTDGQVTAEFVVRVIPSNDSPPQIQLPAGTVGQVLQAAEGSTALGVVTATDPDIWPGETAVRPVSLRIAGGADADRFVLDPASGRLSFRDAMDFEAPGDADHDNRYEVLIEASDGSLQSTARLSVVLTGVDEPPVIVTNLLDVQYGVTRVELVSTDPETPTAQRVYRVSGEVGGWLALSSAPTVRLQTFTQAQVDAGQIVFRLDGSGRQPAYELTLGDGRFSIGPAAALVKVVGAIPVASLGLAVASASQDAPAEAAAATTAEAAGEDGTGKGSSVEGLLARRPTSAGDANVDALLADRAAADAGGRASDSVASPTVRSAAAGAAAAARSAGAPGAPAAEAAAAGLGDARGASLGGLGGAMAWRPVAGLDLSDASSSRQLQAMFDKLRDEVSGDTAEVTVAIGSTALLSGGLSVGYVLWLLRGGVLIATVMSSVPAWAGIDPLPVLSQHRSDDEDEGDNDADPIERLFSRARKLVARGEHVPERPTQAANLTPEVGS